MADTEPAPDPQPDGSACTRDADCQSGRCLTDELGFPGGLCTVENCASRSDCYGVGTACLRGQFNGNLCIPLCSTDDDCRPGYDCVGSGAGSYCYPAFAADALNPTCADEFVAAADVTATGVGISQRLDRHRISFSIDPGTTSFYVVAWSRDHLVYPDVLTAPDGNALAMRDYASYLFTPTSLERVSPLLFPGGPQFASWVQAGNYTLDLGTDGPASAPLCFAVMQEHDALDNDAAPPMHVDLNIYFAGATDLDASNAAADPDFAAMLQSFDQTYGQIGITAGTVRFYDVGGDVLETYRIIRDQDLVYQLVQLSRQPGSSRDALLSANVFFIQGFGGELSSVLGISTGIPGTAGVHGQPGAGLVFSSEYLREGTDGSGARLVGQVLAHELGHFLGLFHTSETAGFQYDPIDDTPTCPTIRDGNLAACDDYNNLMFPVASFRDRVDISPEQAQVIRANPLTKSNAE